MDELDWIRVIDHSKYLCRSWQNLYFPARVCRLVHECNVARLSLNNADTRKIAGFCYCITSFW